MADRAGMRYGKLVVIARACAGKEPMWECLCDCGKRTVTRGSSLTTGHTKSCGCSINPMAGRKHGFCSNGTASRIYRIWRSMRSRCTLPSYPSFNRYGGQGVTVCERWLNSFECFLADMGEPPSEDHSIDRFPNKEGNYEPGNCRWATRKEQNRNTRANVMLTYQGETLSMVEMAEKHGANYGRLQRRIKAGWSVEAALLTAKGERRSAL